MNRCTNCSHPPHDGFCDRCDHGKVRHVLDCGTYCNCYTEKAASLQDRREALREKCKLCEETDADFQGLCLRCIRQNSVKYPKKKDK